MILWILWRKLPNTTQKGKKMQVSGIFCLLWTRDFSPTKSKFHTLKLLNLYHTIPTINNSMKEAFFENTVVQRGDSIKQTKISLSGPRDHVIRNFKMV